MEKVIQHYSDKGKLIFADGHIADVNYSIDEVQRFATDGLGGEIPSVRNIRGRVWPHVGNAYWHPFASFASQNLVLVMKDGRKLNGVMGNARGDFEGSGDFFTNNPGI